MSEADAAAPIRSRAGLVPERWRPFLHRRLPRYTSYPTAAQFTPAVDARRHAGWLADLPADATLSLYLHIPFCAQLCLYCGCHTTAVRRYAPIEAYAELLSREIDRVAALLGTRRPVVHLHWGGGTPTILAPDDFLRLTAQLRERFAFAPAADCAIEIDPRRLTAAHVAALAAAGITRTSLGVQDFDVRVQQAIGRRQSLAETAIAAERLRKAGIASINLDLIYGLPYQTVASVRATMRLVLTLAPDRIALFGYAHVPWMRRQQRLMPEHALPDADARYAQAEAAAEVLVAGGYIPVGLDHFAKPHDALARAARSGGLRRNFQGYTTDPAQALLGFGSSAISALPQGYVQNATAAPAYRAAIESGGLASARGHALTAEDRLRGAIIERLMCELAVDLEAIAAAHGAKGAGFARELALIDRLAEAGLVQRSGTRIRVPETARPFVRIVCNAFDVHAAPEGERYSRAV